MIDSGVAAYKRTMESATSARWTLHESPNFQLASNKNAFTVTNGAGASAHMGALIAMTMFQPDNAAHNQSRPLIPRRQVVSSQNLRGERMEMLSWNSEASLSDAERER